MTGSQPHQVVQGRKELEAKWWRDQPRWVKEIGIELTSTAPLTYWTCPPMREGALGSDILAYVMVLRTRSGGMCIQDIRTLVYRIG